MISISKPTKKQLEHDAWLVFTAFVAAALSVWQAQPDKFSKAALVAAVTAGGAAVLTLAKSTITDF